MHIRIYAFLYPYLCMVIVLENCHVIHRIARVSYNKYYFYSKRQILIISGANRKETYISSYARCIFINDSRCSLISNHPIVTNSICYISSTTDILKGIVTAPYQQILLNTTTSRRVILDCGCKEFNELHNSKMRYTWLQKL